MLYLLSLHASAGNIVYLTQVILSNAGVFCVTGYKVNVVIN